MAESKIQQLRVYELARCLEEQVFDLVRKLPAEQFYPLGNDLRRGSSAVAHYINEAHSQFSYRFKIEALHSAVREAEQIIKRSVNLNALGIKVDSRLIEDYTALIKQCWGLLKWLKAKRAEKDQAEQVKMTDEMVAARA